MFWHFAACHSVIRVARLATCCSALQKPGCHFDGRAAPSRVACWHFLILLLTFLFGAALLVHARLCVMAGEYFTSPDYWPIRSLAANSKNGVVQAPWCLDGFGVKIVGSGTACAITFEPKVVLQGLGQGFLSTSAPAILLAPASTSTEKQRCCAALFGSAASF